MAYYSCATAVYLASVGGIIDGAVTAQDPGLVALAHAQVGSLNGPEQPAFEDIVLLSIGTVKVSRFVDGSRHDWGQGYGFEAMQLGLKFAFHELNLHRVQLTVFSYDERAISLYRKLDFTQEGVFREHLQRDGQRFDMILFGLLRREWEDSNQ